MPNGQHYRVAPRQMGGERLDRHHRRRRTRPALERTGRTGLPDFRLPQHGICVIGSARFDTDPARHLPGDPHSANTAPHIVLGGRTIKRVSPPTASGRSPAQHTPSRAEVLAALSVAIDPAWAARRTYAACGADRYPHRDRLGLNSEQRDCGTTRRWSAWIGLYADLPSSRSGSVTTSRCAGDQPRPTSVPDCPTTDSWRATSVAVSRCCSDYNPSPPCLCARGNMSRLLIHFRPVTPRAAGRTGWAPALARDRFQFRAPLTVGLLMASAATRSHRD